MIYTLCWRSSARTACHTTLMPSLPPPRPPVSTRLSLRPFSPRGHTRARDAGLRLLLRTRGVANPVRRGHSSPPGAQRQNAGRCSCARAVQLRPERGSAIWRLGEGAPGGLRNQRLKLRAFVSRVCGKPRGGPTALALPFAAAVWTSPP